jgi:hypothetical protein
MGMNQTSELCEQYEALGMARLRETAAEYKADYGKRAGVEGTISHGVRVCGLRRSRYAGEATTHLQHLATAAAINVIRISSWLMERPREQTRTRTGATGSLFASASILVGRHHGKNRQAVITGAAHGLSPSLPILAGVQE